MLSVLENEKKLAVDGHWHDELQLPSDGYGPAVTEVYSLTDGSLWVANGEYASEVKFCPVCGHESLKDVK